MFYVNTENLKEMIFSIKLDPARWQDLCNFQSKFLIKKYLKICFNLQKTENLEDMGFLFVCRIQP
jgi:hypothetical protein